MKNIYLILKKKELCIRKNNAKWNIPNGGFYIGLTFNEKINIEELFYSAARENILLNSGYIYMISNITTL